MQNQTSSQFIQNKEQKTSFKYIMIRYLALIIDSMIILGLSSFFIGFSVLFFPSMTSFIVTASLATFFSFLYFILLEAFGGRTFGKMLTNLQVQKLNGQSCGFISSFIRNFLRFIDYQFSALVGLLAVYMSKRQQRVGDMAAKTTVVTSPSSGILKAIGGVVLALSLLLGIVGWVIGGGVWMMYLSNEGLPNRQVSIGDSGSKFQKPVDPNKLNIHDLKYLEKPGSTQERADQVYRPDDGILIKFKIGPVGKGPDGKSQVEMDFNFLDPKGKSMLASPVHANLNKEIDSNQQIPVSVNYVLPTYSSDGPHQMKLKFQDLVSGQSLSYSLPFRVDGPKIRQTGQVSIQNLKFIDPEGKERSSTSYQKKDVVRLLATISGHQHVANTSRAILRGKLEVYNEKGRREINNRWTRLDSNIPGNYEAEYVPLLITVKTSGMRSGRYTIQYTLEDRVADKRVMIRKDFFLE